MSKRFSFLLILLILNLCQTQKRKRNLMSEGELSDDIIIIHTNDVHCAADENIGYDGLMLYKKELEKKYKNVITVDVGDHIQGGTLGTLSKGLDIIDLMNEIKYDVVILGNHEFDYGLDQLDICSKKISCGYISANYCYRKNKTSIFKPYKIVEKGDKKIAFIGVTTPQTLSKSYLHNILDENKNMVYDFLTERDGQELYETIQGYINEVREKGADYVIILAHLGNEGDASEKYTSNGLLSHLSGVNAVLDGHSHRDYSLTSKDKDGKDVVGFVAAGIIDKIREFTIFLNPSEDSYARLGNNTAPDKVNWSSEGDAELIYIETYNGRTRVELRSPDASSNLYLIYALLIDAGIHGIREKKELPEEKSESALMLPGSIREASKLALESEFVRKIVPAGIIREYTNR